MRHEVSYREMATQEARRQRRAAGLGCEGLIGDFFIIPGIVGGGFIVLGILVGAGAGWAAARLRWAGMPAVMGVVVALSALAGLAATVAAVRTQRRARRLARNDIADRRVQVIRAETARLVEREQWNDEGPIYYFGLGEHKVLLVVGQWLYGGGEGLYGEADDPNEDEAPFPCASFTLHRLPKSGQVLRIHPEGPRLAAEAVIPNQATLPDWAAPSEIGDSFMLTGDFEELVRLGTPVAAARP
jgi:hypothetical protein